LDALAASLSVPAPSSAPASAPASASAPATAPTVAASEVAAPAELAASQPITPATADASEVAPPPAEVQIAKPYQRGIASWYGPGFHGRKTANGERFDRNAMTAAHRSLPFGTRVRVRLLSQDRAVEVRINDRGPFVPGRIIDLSQAAAQALGIAGIAQVQLELLLK
jgi:rare lipoprotein A